MIAAGIVGALLTLGGAWALGLLGNGANDDLVAERDELRAGQATLAERLAALEARPVADASDAAGGLGEEQVLAIVDRRLADSATADGADAADLRPEIETITSRLDRIDRSLESGAGGDAAAVGALQERVDGLATRVTALSAASVEPDAVAERIAEAAEPLRSGVSEAQSAITAVQERVAALDEARQSQSDRLAEITRTLDTVVATNDEQAQSLDALGSDAAALRNEIAEAQAAASERVVGVEERVGSIDERLAAVVSTTEELARDVADDNPERRAAIAIAAANLKARVDEGRAFETELAILRDLGAGAELEPLAAYAGTGVQRVGDLRSSFDAAAKAIRDATATPAPSAQDRLLSSLRSALDVEAGSDDPNAPANIIAEIRAQLAANDPAGALAAWQRLPAAAQEASSEWANALQARVAAENVVPRTLQSLSGAG